MTFALDAETKFVYKLAMSQLLNNSQRTWVTSLGIAFSSALIVFQCSLLWGFMQAGMSAINRIDGDLWVVPEGVKSFDFSVPMQAENMNRLFSIDGIEKAQKLLIGFTALNSLSGSQHGVLLIGIDSIGGLNEEPMDLVSLPPDTLIVDSSSLKILGIDSIPANVEINRQRAFAREQLDDISTFIGTPYAFSNYKNAQKWMNIPTYMSHFFVVNIDSESDPEKVSSDIEAEIENIEALTATAFGWRSSTFWLLRTGAGGGLLMAAVVGALIGFVIISQTAYGAVIEHYEEFATIRAIGGGADVLRKVIIIQSIFYGCIAGGIGVILSIPVVVATQFAIVDWIETPFLLLPGTLFFVLFVALVASRNALRKIEDIDPAIVFRS